MSDEQEADGALILVIEWIFRHGASNAEVAILSNVCLAWRRAVHKVMLQQASDGTSNAELLLLPSMLRCLLRGSISFEAELSNETFCAAWFRPDGIRERFLSLQLTKEDELAEIQKRVQEKLLVMSSSSAKQTKSVGASVKRFAPNGDQIFDGSDDEEDERDKRRIRRHMKTSRSRSPVRRGGESSHLDQRKAESSGVPAMQEWCGYRNPIDILQHFGYRSSFVDSLIKAAVREVESMSGANGLDQSENMLLENVKNDPETRCYPTFAVRGATVIRPEGYCLCMEDTDANNRDITTAEVAKIIRTQTSDCDEEDEDDDYDDEEIEEIRLQEYRDYLVRKEQNRRELQRETFPRVVRSSPPIKTVSNRSVQFLNASGNHAVCAMTPPFACGPLVEPVTIICVAIASEDGCFLSGLHHRFELGHLYPENEVREMIEQSAICIATEAWSNKTEAHESLNEEERHHDSTANGSDGGLRFSLSDDGSNSFKVNRSLSGDDEGESSWTQERCTCLFRDSGTKMDETDSDSPRQIYRGRFGPGSWHCYTAIYDGDNSEIRVDGVAEPMSIVGSTIENAKAMLDGLTLGSDHCFGVSLCCGQQPSPRGDGAISEVAVFQGRLAPSDLTVLEHSLMEYHGIPMAPDDDASYAGRENEIERRAEALFLWPSIPTSSHHPIDETPVPLRYMTRNPCVAWKQYHPVTGVEIKVARIGVRNSASSSDW